MKILGIDTSGLVASVAVVSDDTTDGRLLAEYTVNYKKTHSQTLLPMLDEVCRMLELDLNELDAIAVAAGPGSFTGLRIGSATAKGLGLALEKPVVSVPTIDALAYNLYGTDRLVCPVMDARRGQVYTGIYEFRDGNMEVLTPQKVCMLEDVAEELCTMGRKVIFLGDGVPVFKERLETDYAGRLSFSFAPAHMNRQRAGSVAALAVSYVRNGQVEDADTHVPVYLRLPQAERDRLKRQQEAKGGAG